MRIARFLCAGRPTIAVDGGNGYVDFGAILESRGFGSEIKGQDPDRRMIRMLRRGMLDEEFIREQLESVKRTGGGFKLDIEGKMPLLPLRPGKIVCIARNWADHAKEGGHEPPKHPVYFAKTDNCAIGYGESIPLPEGFGRIDHEGELGVLISRQATRVKASDYGDYVLGYTVFNDVTAREFQQELAREGRPWYAAKSMDGFGPLGPAIVMRAEAEPIAGKRIRVWVNGKLRQDGKTDDMLFKVPELIEEITRHVTLVPGDMIATGTPAGVGELHDGDVVAVEIDGIGRLENPVKSI